MDENDQIGDSSATVPAALSLSPSGTTGEDRDQDTAISLALSSSDSRQTADTDVADNENRRGSSSFFPTTEEQRGPLSSVSEAVRQPPTLVGAFGVKGVTSEHPKNIDATQAGTKTTAKQPVKWHLAVSRNYDEQSEPDESASSSSDSPKEERLSRAFVEASAASGVPPEPPKNIDATPAGTTTTAKPPVTWDLGVSRNDDKQSEPHESASSSSGRPKQAGSPRDSVEVSDASEKPPAPSRKTDATPAGTTTTMAKSPVKWHSVVPRNDDEQSEPDESASSSSYSSTEAGPPRAFAEASDASGVPPKPPRNISATQVGTTTMAKPPVKWHLAISHDDDEQWGPDDSARATFDNRKDEKPPRHRTDSRENHVGRSIGGNAPGATSTDESDTIGTRTKRVICSREGAFGGKVHAKGKVTRAGSGLGQGPPQVAKGSSAAKTHGKSSIPSVGESFLLRAIRSGRPEAVTEALESMDEERAARELEIPRIVAQAAKGGNCQLFALVLDAMMGSLAMDQVPGVLAGAFSVAALEVHTSRNTAEESLSALAMLLQHGTIPLAKDLVFLSRVVSTDTLEECFLQAIASAKNCFIPSLHLSFMLQDAIDEASERDRRVLAGLKQGVDALLAAILKCLPQKVSCVSGGMAACAAILEPELNENRLTYARMGPLAASLSCCHRIVTFATTPLCMNYMLLKFCRGLPALNDGPRAQALDSSRLDTRDEAKGQESLTSMCRGSRVGVLLNRVGKSICGGSGCLSILTIYPGAHFIAVGVVTMPNSYYHVPVMRMVLDAMVYIAALALFTKGVLLHDEGSLTVPEVAFAVYFVAAIASETALIHGRDSREYFLDRWKIPQVLALQMSLAGFVVRALYPGSTWGRGLYAVASPLMYWRLLYYAQILPSQGTTIQVLYSMASELGQFLVVMSVVLLGFSLSFFALFKEAKDATFRDSLLDAFQAMLGEVGLFDDFVGSRHDLAATVLLVCYLIIMSIMLLNLLIAVLSTAHGKVEENILIRVSRARVYTYYRWVVEHDMLPPPLNVAQLAIFVPCRIWDFLFKSNISPVAMRGVGRVWFWLVMGPLAILAGWLLWLTSVPKALSVVWGGRSTSVGSGVARTVLCLLWGILGVPLFLVLGWIAQAPRVLSGQTYELEASHPPHPSELTVEKILKEASGGGVASIRARLKNPLASANSCVGDADAQDDPATLEHVRVLQEYLEGTIKERVDALETSLNKKLDQKFELLLSKLSTDGDRA